jgi:hypothetical protein
MEHTPMVGAMEGDGRGDGISDGRGDGRYFFRWQGRWKTPAESLRRALAFYRPCRDHMRLPHAIGNRVWLRSRPSGNIPGTGRSDLSDNDVFREILRTGRRSASKDYVRFDEIEDVLASADLVALTAPLVRKRPSYWKWVIVGTHNALQGAMVCSLADTTGTAVLTPNSATQMLAWLSNREARSGKPPRERLAEFDVLLDRCLDTHPNHDPLVLTPEQLRDVRRLHHEFRNNFAHFTPKGWSIEKEGLPRIVWAGLDAVTKLMSQPNVRSRMSGNRLRRLKAALKVVKASLEL